MEVIKEYVVNIDTDKHIVYSNNNQYYYDKLLIATGASPKLIAKDPLVLGIHDLSVTFINFIRVFMNYVIK